MLSMSKEIQEKSQKFDLFIAPTELSNFKILDPEKAEILFDIGYNATKKKLKSADPELFSKYLSQTPPAS